MIPILIIVGLIILLFCSVIARTIFFNPHLTIGYGLTDIVKFFKFKQWHNCKTGEILAFCGLFGKGKTLSAVHYVVKQYNKYNNKMVFDFSRMKWVLQRVTIYSNVKLVDVPYVEFNSLQQIVDIANYQKDLDNDNDIRTISIILADELSVQLNSRSFKTNLNPLILNSILTCRHHNISLIYTAQRFAHVDALLRQVSSFVIDCNKCWRIMIHKKFDAWDLENTSDITNLKPLLRFGWFIRDKDYNAYDTLACVGNLVKDCVEGHFDDELSILARQGNLLLQDEEIQHKSSKLKRRIKKRYA